ncbi:MAG: hypothetical protein CVV41_02770 [Candidatus Riflebacteria bacterium HGW-Riflebacteria-1]|jgi:hypothetical protein|nr:MAG: hypothetical protein CVV41_02770 [Candidatus Riflebacteria bacterium HGW-Riflebacteria-1]
MLHKSARKLYLIVLMVGLLLMVSGDQLPAASFKISNSGDFSVADATFNDVVASDTTGADADFLRLRNTNPGEDGNSGLKFGGRGVWAKKREITLTIPDDIHHNGTTNLGKIRRYAEKCQFEIIVIGNANVDWSDLRLTDWAGNQIPFRLLDFERPTDNANTPVRLLFEADANPLVPVASNTYYLYYANKDAVSVEDTTLSRFYIINHDFEDGLNDWVLSPNGTGTGIQSADLADGSTDSFANLLANPHGIYPTLAIETGISIIPPGYSGFNSNVCLSMGFPENVVTGAYVVGSWRAYQQSITVPSTGTYIMSAQRRFNSASFNTGWATLMFIKSGAAGRDRRYDVAAGFSDWMESTVDFTINTPTRAAIVGLGMQTRKTQGQPTIRERRSQVDWVEIKPRYPLQVTLSDEMPAGYTQTGVYESDKFDTGVANPVFESITWSANTTAPGTSVAFQTRTAAVLGDLDSAAWSAPITINGSGIAASARYLQVRAILATTDTSVSPVLNEIEIFYSLPVADFRIDAPATVRAGEYFDFRVTAVDQNNATATSFIENLTLSASSLSVEFPRSSHLFTTFDNGTTVFQARNPIAEAFTITAVSGVISSDSLTIQTTPANAVSLELQGFPAAITAGALFSGQIIAKDRYGNTDINNNGQIVIQTTDAAPASFPASINLVAGIGNLTDCSFFTAPIQTLEVKEAASGIATFTDVLVSAGAATRLHLSAEPDQYQNVEFNLEIAAVDDYGNPDTSIDTAATLTSSLGTVATSSFDIVAGLCAHPVTLDTAGNLTLSALTATALPGDLGLSVHPESPPTLHRFLIDAGYDQLAGVPFTLTIEARDSSEQVLTSYDGACRIIPSVGQCSPAMTTGYKFLDGFLAIPISLSTADSNVILRVEDVKDSSKIGLLFLNVRPAGLAEFEMDTPHAADAGATFTFKIRARDNQDNLLTNYTGTVIISHTATGGDISIPTIYTFLDTDAGEKTFSGLNGASFTKAENIKIQVEDSGKVGLSDFVTIRADSSDPIVELRPDVLSVELGTSLSFNLYLKDRFDNVLEGFIGTMSFSYSDPTVAGPASYAFKDFENGYKRFLLAVTPANLGDFTVTATEDLSGNSDTTDVITVISGETINFTFDPSTKNLVAGENFSFDVTASNSAGNLNEQYNGGIRFSTLDPLALIPQDSTLVNGQGTFQATYFTAGSYQLSVFDNNSPSISGNMTVTVQASAPLRLVFDLPAYSTTAGIAVSYQLKVVDAFGNPASFTDDVSVSSTDNKGTSTPSPQDITFTNQSIRSGLWTFTTAGTQRLRATVAGLTAADSLPIKVDAGPADRITGDFPAFASSELTTPFIVRVVDVYNNPTPAFTNAVNVGSTGVYNNFFGSDHTFSSADKGTHVYYLRWDLGNANEPPIRPPGDMTVTFTPAPLVSIPGGAITHTLRVDNPRSTTPPPEFPFLRSWLSLPDRQVVASEPFRMTYQSLSIRETAFAISSVVDVGVSDGSIAVSRDGVTYDSSITLANESEVTFWAIVTRTGFLSVVATPGLAPAFTGSVGFLSHPGPVARITIQAETPQKAGERFPWTLEWWDACDNYARKAVEAISMSAAAIGLSDLDPQQLLLSGHDGRFNQQDNRQWLTDDFIVSSATSDLKVDYEKREISIKGPYDENFSEDLVMAPNRWQTLRFGQDGNVSAAVTQFTAIGDHNFTVPDGVTSVDYLVVGGGGAGGGAYNGREFGGGGGAGGMITGTMAVIPGQAISITVGAGGAGANNLPGDDGSASSFGAIAAAGGGGGGKGEVGAIAVGRDGSSGGGGGSSSALPNPPGGSGITGQGNAGGAGRYNATATNRAAGGGGGAGAAGADSPGNANGGAGGAGLQSNITGANVWYAGGGGGSGNTTAGAGGTGGGGAAATNANGTAGTANRGGGGGGGGRANNTAANRAGGNGGSGIVIVRYLPVLSDPSFVVENGQLRFWTLGGGSISNHLCDTSTANSRWQEDGDDSYYLLYFDWPANDIFAFNATLTIRRMWFDTFLDYSLCHAGIMMRDDSHATRPRFVSAMLRRVDNSYPNNQDIGVFSAQAVYRNTPNGTRFRRKFGTSPSTVTTHPLAVGIWRDAHSGSNPGRFRPMACHDGQNWRELSGSNGTAPDPQPNVAATVYTRLGISVGANSNTRPGMAWIDDFRVNRYPQSASFTSVVYDIGTSAVTLTDPIRVEADFNTGTANVRLYMRGSNDAVTIGAQSWEPLALGGGNPYTATPLASLNRRYIQYALLLSANWVGNNGGQDFYDATPYVRSVQIDYTTGVQGATFAERNVEPPATIIASFSPTITAETQVEILGGTVASLAIDVPASATAGVPFTISVKALDAFGNIADDYDKTWSFMTSDGDPFPGVVPGDYTMVPAADAGQHTFYNASVLFNGPTKTITVTDGTLTTVSDPIIVNPGRIGAFALFALSPQAAGTIFPLSIEALDVYNNLKTNYSGIMTFNDNRTGGTALYSPATLAAASWTTGLATLTPGVSFTKAETINVTGQSSYRSGVSNPIEISNAPPAALLLSVSTTSPDSGIPFSVTLKVLDIYGNIARNYLGTVHFSCNDAHPAVALPVNYLFTGADAGQKVFTDEFVLITPGSVNLRVVDTVNATMTHQFPLTVLPGPATRFELSCSDIQTAGVPFNLIVKVYDDYGNIKTNFSETINLLSSFTSILPFSAGGFSNGQLLIPSVELNEVGVMPATKKIAAVFGSVVGDKDVALWPSSQIFDRFDMETIPLEPTVGDAFKLVIKAVGPDGNVFTGYDNAGVFLTASNSSGLAVDPPMMPVEANGFTIGVKELYARNWEAGEITIWAANKGVPPVVGSLTVNFLPTNLSHFTVVPGTSTVDPFPNNYYQTVNGSFPVFLKAYDTIGNIKTDYTGTVQITHNGIGTLSVTLATFVDGVATISATAYNNPGKIRLTARDGVLNRSGTSGNIYFFGPLARFDVACGYDQTDETAFLTMLSAIDVYDQEKLNYNSQANTQRLAWNLGPLTDVALMPPSLPLTWDDGKNYVWLKVDRPAAGADIGTFTFNVLDDADSSKTGTATVNIHKNSVLPAVALLIEAFSPQQSTKPFPMAVKAVDVNNAVVKSWSGDTTLGIVSTLGDTETIYPSAISLADFVDGVYATTTARIDVPATYTVTAVSGALTGVFSPLYVKPGKVSEIRLTVPPYAPLNSPFTISVAGLTADGQVKSDYVPEGPIHLKLNATSTGYLGVQFVYPEDFSGGVATINTQTYNKSQTIWITAIENVDNLKSTAGPILVFGPPVRLVLQPQPDASANFYWNAWFQVRVNVLDVNGYPVANFSGDIDFSAQPGGAPTATDPTILPGFESQFFDVDSMGSQLFYLKVLYSTPASPINLVLEAENAANSIADVTGNLTFLKESVFDSFEIVSPTSGMAVPKNRPFPVRVRAVDNFGMPYTLLSSFPTLTAELLSPPGLTMFSASPTSPLEFLNTSELLLVGNVDYAESSTATVRFTVTPEDMSPAGDMVDFAIIEGYNIKDSVYQEIATTTFTNPGRYILSGYVSPGTGSADIKFTLIDAVGEPVESYGVRIASSGVCTHIGPLGPIVSYGSSRPIAGGNSLSDHNLWYRIHVVFDYQFVPAIASETIIHLQNSTPDGYPASASVLFDGMLLEKTTDLEQMRPTSFAPQGWQIYSPSRQRSLSGEYQYYEQ